MLEVRCGRCAAHPLTMRQRDGVGRNTWSISNSRKMRLPMEDLLSVRGVVHLRQRLSLYCIPCLPHKRSALSATRRMSNFDPSADSRLMLALKYCNLRLVPQRPLARVRSCRASLWEEAELCLRIMDTPRYNTKNINNNHNCHHHGEPLGCVAGGNPH